MLALERLSLTSKNFNETISAHTASLKAIRTVLEMSFESYQGDSNRTKLEEAYKRAGIKTDFDLFVEECETVEKNDFFYARKNSFLGICSAFDEFVFSCVAALSYEPGWRELDIGKRMFYETNDEQFYERFVDAEKSCNSIKPALRRRSKFLSKHFQKLNAENIERLDAVFWIRNQLTHNLNKAKEAYPCKIFGKQYCLGTEIILDRQLLNDALATLRKAVNDIYTDSPVLDEF